MASLKHYGVIGLAIAVVIGGKLNAVVDGIVKELLMPILAALVDFLIVAFVIFYVSKMLTKLEIVPVQK